MLTFGGGPCGLVALMPLVLWESIGIALCMQAQQQTHKAVNAHLLTMCADTCLVSGNRPEQADMQHETPVCDENAPLANPTVWTA